jgi:hypothetical protein
VIAFVPGGAALGWFTLMQIWILLLLWYRPRRQSFSRRLNQLLALLLAGTGTVAGSPSSAEGRTLGRLVRPSLLGRTKWSARRWQGRLRPIYAQGYEAAAETISPSGQVAHGRDLVEDTLAALKAQRRNGGAKVPAREDPVVVVAYGLGAWPPGADLTSLERLLRAVGVSQPALRSSFDKLLRSAATSDRTREFRELAGAAFVLGAAARILEAAASGGPVPPPGFLAMLRAHRR